MNAFIRKQIAQLSDLFVHHQMRLKSAKSAIALGELKKKQT